MEWQIKFSLKDQITNRREVVLIDLMLQWKMQARKIMKILEIQEEIYLEINRLNKHTYNK